jgi:GNAT superfamily N-acetyltransferase
MSIDVSVRPAAPRDLKALLAMCDALNAQSGIPTGRLDPKQFRAALFGRRAFMFADIAEASETGDAAHGGGPVGYALSHDAFSTDFGERGAYLIDVYVEPAWRRAGVGKALMAAVAARARERGGTHVWWATMPFNYQARRFYARLGASDEPFHTHAVFGKAFDRLAAKGGRASSRSAA